MADLLRELNELRKGFSYGELTTEPAMTAEEIAAKIEEYVEAVDQLLLKEEE